MLSFAVILWAYAQSGPAMTVSLMAFCSYLPYILISLLDGGLLGGMLVSFRRRNPAPVKMIYLVAAISFLFDDLMMGVGRNVFWWSIAGSVASLRSAITFCQH